MKFQPQPGDKIICNNGEEFICCTLECLRDKIDKQIHSSLPILGYYKTEYDESWQDWNEDGTTRSNDCNDCNYGIREVIPQNAENSADKKEEVKEEPRYNLQEIKEAWDASGWFSSTMSWNTFRKNLMKSDDDFQEYLRLKAIYE